VGLSALFVGAVSAIPASAQLVTGEVVEEGTGRPLPGAYVVLRDVTGTEIAGTLTDAAGEFVLGADAAGTFALLARLIGHQDTFSGPFDLVLGQTIRRTLTVPVRAVSLEGIRVDATRQCVDTPRGDAQIATLWEEARKALEITEWGAEQGSLRFDIVEQRRELDAPTLQVLAMEEGIRRSFHDRSPYVSIPAEQLAARGYIQPAPDDPSVWEYFAPDGTVLLSESFLQTHCFRIAPDSDDERVGLAFEPVRDRDLPEVEGVLWLDRATAELQRLDFRYLNLPFEHGDWPGIGGQVEFERLDGGFWTVRRWHIRMPLAAKRITTEGGAPEIELQTLSETGARVLRVENAAGEPLSEWAEASLTGVVTEAGSDAPVEGATIRLVAANRQAVTDRDGYFRLTAPPPGTFKVRVSHPIIDRLGGTAFERDVTVEDDRANRLDAEIDLEEAAWTFCRAQEVFSYDAGVVFGSVRDVSARRPLAGALVRIRDERGSHTAAVGPEGDWATCVVARGSVEVEVVSLDARGRRAPIGPGQVVPVHGSGSLLTRVDLFVEADAMTAQVPAEGVAHRGWAWSNSIRGVVLLEADRSPVPGATVLIRDEAGHIVYSALTGPTGQFYLLHPSRRPQIWELVVEHADHGRLTRNVEVGPTEQLRVEVLLGGADGFFDSPKPID